MGKLPWDSNCKRWRCVVTAKPKWPALLIFIWLNRYLGGIQCLSITKLAYTTAFLSKHATYCNDFLNTQYNQTLAAFQVQDTLLYLTKDVQRLRRKGEMWKAAYTSKSLKPCFSSLRPSQAQLYRRVLFLPNEKAVPSGYLTWIYESIEPETPKSLVHREWRHCAAAAPNSLGRGTSSKQAASACQPLGQRSSDAAAATSFIS